MTSDVKDELIELGFDFDSALERFMNNEAMYEKFLKKFIDDGNYAAILEAVNNRNTDAAFKAAHTLKGVCGNLSINNLFDIVNVQVDYFRNGDFDQGAAMMDQLTEEYNKTINVLKKL